MTLALHDPMAMSEADWPPGQEALRAYLEGFSHAGSATLVTNLETRVMALTNSQSAWPVTLNTAEYDNAFVCSPFTTYVSYAKEEMHLLGNRGAEIALRWLASTLGGVLKSAAINQMVQVNNWMLSTNLYSRDQTLPVEEITALLVARFPRHFLCFRSLNAWDNAPLLARFRQAGYTLVASRQVYVYDRLEDSWLAHANAGHDRRLLRQTAYRVVAHHGLVEPDFARMAELYRLLYIEKYSPHNPLFTDGFLRLCHRSGTMTFIGLRGTNGILDGIVGLFIIDGTVTAPIVGYDTSRDRKLGLYRLLLTLVFEFALERGYRINLSSGAAEFKRLRGGEPFIEYSAIYARHLSLGRRIALSALAVPVNAVGVPLMRRFKL